MSKKLVKNKSGMSLLEVVVVVAVFAVTIVMALDLFLTVSSVQRRITVLQEVESNAQLLLESATDNVKNAQIDYEFYQAIEEPLDEIVNNPTHILAIRHSAAPEINQTVIRRSGSEADPWDGTGNNIEFCNARLIEFAGESEENCMLQGPDEWETYISGDSIVTDLKFLISPVTDPYFSYPSEINQQEIVTVNVTVENETISNDEKISVNLQTSFSLNIYKR